MLPRGKGPGHFPTLFQRASTIAAAPHLPKVPWAVYPDGKDVQTLKANPAKVLSGRIAVRNLENLENLAIRMARKSPTNLIAAKSPTNRIVVKSPTDLIVVKSLANRIVQAKAANLAGHTEPQNGKSAKLESDLVLAAPLALAQIVQNQSKRPATCKARRQQAT